MRAHVVALVAAIGLLVGVVPSWSPALSAHPREMFVEPGRLQDVIYALLITIDSGDKRGDVVGMVRGAGSVLDLVEGRDPEVLGGETFFQRYVLKPSLLPVGTPEITCVAWVGINNTVPAVVRNEYSQNTALWRTVEFNGGTFTRAYMQERLRAFAAQYGATSGWQIIPGDVLLDGNLIGHFVPLF